MRIQSACFWLPLLLSACTHDFGAFEFSVGDGSRGPDATRSDAGSSDGSLNNDSEPSDAGSGDSRSVDGSSGVPPECAIHGTTYARGAANPSTACQTCQPSVSSSDWSNLTDGTSCGSDGGDGICHTGACVSGCEVGGVYYVANAANPNDPCQSCQSGKSTSEWSTLADSTSCGNGQVCASGRCGMQCDIDAGIVMSGATNTGNPCQSCQPGTIATAWTNAADGTSCGSGEVCHAGNCGMGCTIGGAFYAPTSTANDGCEVCTPGASTTAWTNANGTSCNGSGTCSAGSCVMPASCSAGGAGMTNCGPGGSGTESCCASLEVKGGTFYRAYDADDAGTGSGEGGTGEADPATVSGFRLDEYLVTVGRFRQFVAAWTGGYYPASASGKHTHLNGGLGLENSGDPGTYETGWNVTWNTATNIDPTNGNLACGAPYATWTNTAGSQENLPISCVNWWESYAFCIWDGGFLPSEAEWEYAAAGGSLQREFPWGATAPGTANQYAIYGEYYTASPTYVAPVGYSSLGAGYWGQFDLAGEVWEWNLDWEALYATCTDCAYLTVTPTRMIAGGSFHDDVTTDLVPPLRFNDVPTRRYYDIGIRCARTP